MRQFLRDARVLVGVGTDAIEIASPKLVAGSPRKPGLAMRFECVKNQFSNKMPNQLTLTVLNLKKSTRDKITERGTKIQLEVGYGDTLQVLFNGKLAHAIHTHERTEWLSTFYCWDLYEEMRESRISLSLRAGVTVKYAVEQVLASFGPAGVTYQSAGIEHLSQKTLLRPLSLSGSSREVMDDLGRSYGFHWGPQDGHFELWGPNAHFADAVTRISSATGMVESPVVTDLGVEVTTLLNPTLRPRRKIIIESVGAGVRVGSIEIRKTIPALQAGAYIIGEVIFTGDTWGNDWLSKIKTFLPGAVRT